MIKIISCLLFEKKVKCKKEIRTVIKMVLNIDCTLY